MSQNLHMVVEYHRDNEHCNWDLGEVFCPSTGTDIFASIDSVAGGRGLPDDDARLASSCHRAFTMLAVADESGHAPEWNEFGLHNDGDSTCVRPDVAQGWVDRGTSKWLGEWHSGFRRLTHPDMASVTWMTTAEFAKAVYMTEDPALRLAPHRAALAAMQSLEANPRIDMVRIVLGRK